MRLPPATPQPRERVPSPKGGRRRAAAAAELAVLLPLLLILALGCVDFGRFAHSYIAVTNAARAGAGVASAKPSTPATLPGWKSAVTQAVADEMSGFDPGQLTVTVSDPITAGEPAGVWRVQVDVSYPFQTLVSWPGIPSNVTLARTVVMRGTR